MYGVVMETEIGVCKSEVKYHKEKDEGTRNEENHMDMNITCKGKGWNSEVHRMKRIGVMKKPKNK